MDAGESRILKPLNMQPLPDLRILWHCAFYEIDSMDKFYPANNDTWCKDTTYSLHSITNIEYRYMLWKHENWIASYPNARSDHRPLVERTLRITKPDEFNCDYRLLPLYDKEPIAIVRWWQFTDWNGNRQ
jgi:hypothetical protein